MIYPGKRYFRNILPLLMMTMTVASYANKRHLADTTLQSTWVFTPRLNSTGHFPFTGALINHHVNADFNIFYEHRPVGFFLFWSRDLVEKSIVNYLQPGIFATATLSPKVKVRIFFGYLFSQAETFRDPDSDYYTAATLYWDFGSGFRLENTALFYDLKLGTKLANRFLLVWQRRKVKVDLYVWERVVLETNSHATSAMLAFTFPQIKLSDKTALVFSSSYQTYLTANRPSWALDRGFLFSLSMPLTVRP